MEEGGWEAVQGKTVLTSTLTIKSSRTISTSVIKLITTLPCNNLPEACVRPRRSLEFEVSAGTVDPCQRKKRPIYDDDDFLGPMFWVLFHCVSIHLVSLTVSRHK